MIAASTPEGGGARRVIGARPPPAAIVLVLALLATTLLPFVAVRYPPLPDASEHLAAVSVIHNLGDPRYDLDRYYETSLSLIPYWGHYGPVHVLAYVFGVEWAGRLLLMLYAVALPIGTALLARRFGRSPYLGVLALPLVWNFNFTVGFIAFCVGLAVLPFALAAFDAMCERLTPARFMLAAGAGLAVYFAHLLPWGAWLGCACAIAVLHQGRSPRAVGLRLLAIAPSFVVAGLITGYGRGLNMGHLSQGLAWKRYPTWQSIGEFSHWIWQGYEGTEHPWLVGALVAAWALLKLSGRRPALTLHGLRAEACFAVALGAYLILPRSVLRPAYWWGVNVRFACIAALMLALTIQGDFDLRRGLRRWLLVAAAACGLAFNVDTTAHWLLAARFTAGYDALRVMPEPGSRVLFVLGHPWHDPATSYNYVHTFYGFYQAQRGGFMPWNFDEGFPLRYRVRYPASSWREQRFEWDRHAPYYDYVFAFNHDGSNLFGAHLPAVTRVGAAGRWTLWRLPGPRRDDSPWSPYPNPYL